MSAFLSVVLVACDSSGGFTPPRSSPQPWISVVDEQLGLELSLSVPVASASDDTITLTLRLKNITANLSEFPVAGNPAHDFVVVADRPATMWSWRESTGWDGSEDTISLDAGREVLLTGEWNPSEDTPGIEPGEVEIYGRLLGASRAPFVLETPPQSLTLYE